MLSKRVLVSETTPNERQEMVDSALALSSLSGCEPNDWVKVLFQRYVNGEMEVSEIQKKVVAHFTQKRDAKK